MLRSMSRPLSTSALIGSLFALACGGDDDAPPTDAAVDDASADASDAGPSGPARAVFDLDGLDDDFFAFPFPSDLRLSDRGTPDLTGFPMTMVTIVGDLARVSAERPAWSVTPVAFFRFTAPLAPRATSDVLAPTPSSPFWLVDVDPASPDRGALVPTIALTLETDLYTGHALVAVASVPGWVLHPGRRYAFVVRADAGGWDGGPVETDETLQALLAGETPARPWGARAAALYAPLRETLATLGVAPADVAHATVFTTGDVVQDLAELVTALRAREQVDLEDLALDPRDGASHERYCELLGTVSMPQFQRGEPPFDTEGRFELGGDGLPIVQRRESARVTVTVPKGPMPEGGYPLFLYLHGSGGRASQVVDRGPFARGGTPAVGEGPAHVIAAHGFGAVAQALPLSPDRLPGASATAYLNLNNLAAFPHTFAQGVIESALLLDAIERLRITPAMLGACEGPTPPAGETELFFDPGATVGLGQSMGAMYLNMLGAIEPRVRALAPTGAGGFWSYMILETELIPGVRGLLASVLRTRSERLSHLHPAMHLLGLGWEPADPMVFMPRVSRRPLAGADPRPIYQPVGRGDSYFPPVLFDAMALAYGHRQAGDPVWASMQESLAWADLEGFVPYPVSDNVQSEAGAAYTGVVVQSAGDGFSDPHDIFMQIPGVRHQWGCFLRSAIDGAPAVPAPAEPGSPCE